MLRKTAGILTIISGLAGAVPAVAENTKVTFILDFISLGRHTPWYVALDKGYYEEEGLDVEILPSKGTADSVRGVVTGLAPIGFIDVPSLVAAGQLASDIKIVASAYVEAPYCIFSLNPGADVTDPKQLEGLKLGSSSASFVPQIWRAVMNQNGLDGSKLEIVNIDPASRVPMLAADKVDAIDLFLMSGPGIKRAAPEKEPVCLFAPDLGLDLYSNSIGVNKNFLESNPEAVKGFVKAAMRGWQFTLANRDEAADIMVKQVESLDRTIVREEIDLLERIGLNDDVMANGFGHILPEKMAATFAFINDNIEVPNGNIKPEDTYVSGFLPDVPIMPEGN